MEKLICFVSVVLLTLIFLTPASITGEVISFEVNGTEYTAYSDLVTWDQAFVNCDSTNALNMVNFETNEELSAVSALLNSFGIDIYFWIGARNIYGNSSLVSIVDGTILSNITYHDTDGCTITSTTEKCCGELDTTSSTRGLHSHPCSLTRGFICEENVRKSSKTELGEQYRLVKEIINKERRTLP